MKMKLEMTSATGKGERTVLSAASLLGVSSLFSFPRDVMDLREFLVSTRNRNSELSLMPLSICCPFIVSAISSGAAARERNTRNGTEGGGGSSTSRRNGPRPPMSRRSAKRARISDQDSHDEVSLCSSHFSDAEVVLKKRCFDGRRGFPLMVVPTYGQYYFTSSSGKAVHF